MGFLSTVLSLSFVALIIYLPYQYIQRAILTPLAKLPGPKLAQLTSLWRLKVAASSRAPQEYRKVHEQYGKVVRTGPRHVSISDPECIPAVYGISSKFTKSKFYDTLTPMKDGKALYSIFSTPSQEVHRKLKSGIAQKYSLSSLLTLEPLVDKVTTSFMNALRKRAPENGGVLDLGEWVQFYAFDVIGAITFSRTFGFIENGKDNGVMKGLEGGLVYGAIVGQVPQIHPYLFGSPFLNKQMGKVKALADANPVPIVLEMVAEALADETMQKDENCEDFITYMRKQNAKDNSKMSEEDMSNNLFVNLLAGSDTTAISLRTILYQVMKNPAIYKKLQREIDEADKKGLLSNPITYAETQEHIPYMALIVKESLRVHPAVALTLERVVPSGGITIDNQYIPEDTVLGVSAWVIHQDKSVFGEDASEFRPERWEAGAGEEEVQRLKRMDRTFFAFGHGARSCIGKNISLMEMSKFVPQFLREFEIEWAGDEQGWTVESSWFAKQTGVMVRYKSRH